MRSCGTFLGLVVLSISLGGCGPASIGIDEPKTGAAPVTDPSTGFETGPWEEPGTGTGPGTTPEEDPRFEGAWVRILSPAPDAVIPWGEPYDYEVGVFAADGSRLEVSEDEIAVTWFASGDPDFESDALAFERDDLALGVHNLTALVDLPSASGGGDRLAHSVGGVKVQSPLAGTYAGLFSVDGSITQLTVSCTGAAVIVIDAEGQSGEGEGDCIVSLLALDVPMTWEFSLESGSGGLTGEAGVNLVGIFSYDIPLTSGSLAPSGAGLELEFAGLIPFVGELDAFLNAPRVSLDTE